LRAIQHNDARSPSWQGLPPKQFFSSLLLRAAISIYYAHPAAWNEIGFGGPASPRGYVRLGFDRRDPWEAEERHAG
jgi:Gluconate 2-dehydrogenase subunit 3